MGAVGNLVKKVSSGLFSRKPSSDKATDSAPAPTEPEVRPSPRPSTPALALRVAAMSLIGRDGGRRPAVHTAHPLARGAHSLLIPPCPCPAQPQVVAPRSPPSPPRQPSKEALAEAPKSPSEPRSPQNRKPSIQSELIRNQAASFEQAAIDANVTVTSAGDVIKPGESPVPSPVRTAVHSSQAAALPKNRKPSIQSDQIRDQAAAFERAARDAAADDIPKPLKSPKSPQGGSADLIRKRTASFEQFMKEGKIDPV